MDGPDTKLFITGAPSSFGALMTLNAVNTAIIHAGEETALLKDICGTAVEVGAYFRSVPSLRPAPGRLTVLSEDDRF